MAANIPKFTSFRPKAPAPAPAESSQALPKKGNSTKSERPHLRDEERGGKSKSGVEPRQYSPGRRAEPSKLYFSDRRGDRNIIKYGGLNRYDVPAYRRYGYGHVLGLPLDWKIDRDHSTDKEFVLTSSTYRPQERPFAGKRASRGHDKVFKVVKTSTTSDAGRERDFIPLSTTGTRKRKEEDSSAEVNYRGFEDDVVPSDSDAEYDSGIDTLLVHTEVTQQNSILVRKTRENPQDLDAWVKLIEHQETMLRMDRKSSDLSSADLGQLAEVRISVYEQALRKIENKDDQIQLYLGLMGEAQKAWEATKLVSKWTAVLTEFPWNVELWMEYLNFIQSCFSRFKYEDCRTMFFKCLQTLLASSQRVQVDHTLHILVRLTVMIQQAGYRELALAVWQALLEFHFMRPDTRFDRTLEDDLSSFEGFWESEAPRIGEVDAKGWRHYNVEDASTEVLGPLPLVPRDPKDSIFEDFSKRELDATKKFKYPGRTLDEIGEDDAFHTILFTDIEGFVRLVNPGTSKISILQAFLRFHHLPPLPRTESEVGNHHFDPFLQLQFQKTQACRDQTDGFVATLSKYARCPLPGFQMTTELLFDQAFAENDLSDVDFVRRALKLITMDNHCGELIGEYLLALESKFFPSEVSKTAKKLLKVRPSSLCLYNAYGLAESRKGNSAKADQVFSAALSMQKPHDLFSTLGSCKLFSNWVWEALRQGNNKKALWRLVSPQAQGPISSVDDEDFPDQADLLRARSIFSNSYERALLGNELLSAVITVSLLALLAYLSTGETPENALLVHHKLTEWFIEHKISQSTAAELHVQSIARLLTYHASHANIVKPSLLRTCLEPLIARFPNNTILLSLYAANEARFSINDRVRTIMQQTVLSSTECRSIVGWSFAIHYEVLRGEVAGSTAHSIRALFNKAEKDLGAHCPAIWKEHLLFELEEAKKESRKNTYRKSRREREHSKNMKRKEEDEAKRKVKETFFKGMTQLPWCKDFFMLAFTHLGEEHLTSEELQKVYNVMVEKELRLFIEIEEAPR